MLLSRSKPPLWIAILVAPLFYNALAIAIAAIGYLAVGRPALLSILCVWIASAGRLLMVVDSYEIGESRRALAVVGALFWLAASFCIIALIAYGIGRL